MAFVSELVGATAEAVGYSLPTIQAFARVLREHDLVSQHGRGHAAAHATPMDAARLTIALLATPVSFAGGKIPDCAEAVRDFGSLVQGDQSGTDENLAAVYGLPRRHTLEDALAAIIAGFAEGKESEIAVINVPPFKSVNLEVSIDSSVQATISAGAGQYHYGFPALVDQLPDGIPRRPVREYPSLQAAAAEWERVAAKYNRGVYTKRSVRFDALQKIAAAINGEAK